MNWIEKTKLIIRADAFDAAAFEAGKDRVMILSKENIEDGMLSDDHPVIRARKQMRNEIVSALKSLAEASRKAAKNL